MNIKSPGIIPEIRQVKISDPFWSPLIDKFRKVTLPYVIGEFLSPEHGDVRENFVNAAEYRPRHVGTAWHDGLIYEVITAASDFLAAFPDGAIESRIDELAEIIRKAQDAGSDGYLSTFTQAMAPGNRFGTHGGNALVQHDLYNLGCLIEAGVHNYRATGKTVMLFCAVRAAEYLCDTIGGTSGLNIVPGHSMIEYTMTGLYVLFRDDAALRERMSEMIGRPIDENRYIELVRFFLEGRGRHTGRDNCPANLTEYAQDHRPLAEQDEAVGHAVRAMLLYAGLTAFSGLSGDGEGFAAAKALWRNVTGTKLHISGGVGAMSFQENFGFQYQLPENAYLETCAGAALVFWAAEMGRIDGSSEYYDVLERALCNNVLSGVSENGTEFFYQNPLVSNGDVSRWSWHDCPCCPPMLLKAVSSLGRYIYTQDSEGVSINLRIGSTVSFGDYSITQKDGRTVYRSAKKKRLKIRIRIPEYDMNPSFTLNGEPAVPENDRGYAVFDRFFSDGDEIAYSADEPVICIRAHPYSDEISGKVSFQRGRFLLCAEGCDNGGDVSHPVLYPPSVRTAAGGVAVTCADGSEMTLVPYYRWNNRGSCKMAVWFPAPGLECSKFNTDGWENRLYRLEPVSDKKTGQ